MTASDRLFVAAVGTEVEHDVDERVPHRLYGRVEDVRGLLLSLGGTDVRRDHVLKRR